MFQSPFNPEQKHQAVPGFAKKLLKNQTVRWLEFAHIPIFMETLEIPPVPMQSVSLELACCMLNWYNFHCWFAKVSNFWCLFLIDPHCSLANPPKHLVAQAGKRLQYDVDNNHGSQLVSMIYKLQIVDLPHFSMLNLIPNIQHSMVPRSINPYQFHKSWFPGRVSYYTWFPPTKVRTHHGPPFIRGETKAKPIGNGCSSRSSRAAVALAPSFKFFPSSPQWMRSTSA